MANWAFAKKKTKSSSVRVNHPFSPHTCGGENKSSSIRVFSLTVGLRTRLSYCVVAEKLQDGRHRSCLASWCLTLFHK